MPLARILLYPIKSLDGVSVPEARITAGGILEHDRAYAIVDEVGAYVNGKRTDRVHALRSSFSDDLREVTLWQNGDTTKKQFALSEPKAINQWLSQFFDFTVKLIHEPNAGFPDDRGAPGPTIISTATLREVCGWFPGMTLENARRRFRANLELGGEIPFWEDRLYGAPDELKPFRIGDVKFLSHNPCQRCVVPTRDPDSGGKISDFQKTFMERRRESLPAWAVAERFNHFYRLAVNTSVPGSEAGKALRVGDVIDC